MTNAILNITDGTLAGTVSLINGPFYLQEWQPAITDYKEGGVYVDSPLSDGSRIVFKRFANALERFVVAHDAESPDDAAVDMQKLLGLLERASDYWISNGRKGSIIYLEARAHGETGTRYANIISGRVPSTSNLFSQPFMQQDCTVVQDNMNVIVERGHWRGAPPGGAVSVPLPAPVSEDNYLLAGDFDDGPQSSAKWTTANSPTVVYTNALTYKGAYSARITGTAGAERGIYQDVGTIFLTSGAEYTVSAWVNVQTGGAQLKAWDGGGFTNGVSDSTTESGWQKLTVQKTATASGIRVGLLTDSSFYTVAYFSGAFLGRIFGQSLQTRFSAPVLVSNYYGQTHLTHIFTHDVVGAGFSSNLLDSDLPYSILPTGAAVGDFVYFGSKVSNDIGGPFSSIAFNLGQAAGSVNAQILTNTSFESNFTGWTTNKYYTSCGTVQRTSAYGAYSGSFAARLSYPNYSCIPQNVAVLPYTGYLDILGFSTGPHTISGTSVRFGGRFKWDRTIRVDYIDEIWSALLVLKIKWYSAGGALAGTDEKVIPIWAVGVEVVSSDWTYGEIIGQKPAGATNCHAEVVLRVNQEFAKPSSRESSGDPPLGFLFDVASLREPAADFDVDWEYWNGSSWTGLTVRDNTENFTIPGLNVVSWQIPDDWERNTINSSLCYWVRAEIASLSGTFLEPEQNITHPYVVAQPYVDIPSDGLGGDLSALGRLHIRNEGGPFDDTTSIRVTAGANDVFANHDTSTLTTGGATGIMAADRSIGLRFENIQIPQGAKIYRAQLWVTPAGYESPQSNDENAWIDLHLEDADNPSLWASYADYNGRALTTEHGEQNLSYSVWSTWVDWSNKVNIGLAGAVQEVVDRAGWSPGNAMHVRIKEKPEYLFDRYETDIEREFSFYETAADSWELEIFYVQNETYTTTVVAGTRNLSRGDMFNAYINMRPSSQNGIKVAGAGMLGDAHVAVPNRSAIVFNMTDPNAPAFTRRGRVTIPRQIADHYTGTFRTFLRVSHDFNRTGSYETSLYMRFYAGPSVIKTKTVSTGSDTPQFIDMGQVTIPELTSLDSITIDIYLSRPDVTLSANEKGYIHDLVLIPADEWVGEFTSRSPYVSGQLNADRIMQIDSIDPGRGHIEALLLDENTGLKRGALSHSANKLAFDPKETTSYRLWLLAISDTFLDWQGEILVSGPDVERRGGLSGAVHSVQFYSLPTYLSLRGAR